MTDPSLWHVTVNTGHARRSLRAEVDDAAVSYVAGQIAEALAGMTVDVMPDCQMTCTAVESVLVVSLTRGAVGDIVHFAVCGAEGDSARAWRLLSGTGEPPVTPWCAAVLMPGAAAATDIVGMIGDFERTIAWAWLERDL